MNEENLSRVNSESFSNLSNTLENPESTGMDILAAFLSMPDEDFELLRPVVQDSIISTYDDPQVKLQMAQALAESGISITDLINNTDEVAKAILQIDSPELNDSKKSFLQFVFTSIANTLSDSTLNPARLIEIPVEICRENAKLPTYATNGSAAMDIYSPAEYTIDCGQTIIIPIGIKVAIPHGYALLVQPRSGMSRRMKVRIPNSPGLIDEDYHEEIGVIVENITPLLVDVDLTTHHPAAPDGEPVLEKLYGGPITIGKGERFAQLRLVEVPRVKWRTVDSIGTFENDHGSGFGSTGVM